MTHVKRHWPAMVAGVVLVAAAGTALAFGGHRGGGCDRGDMQVRAAYRLSDLTDQQRKQLDQLQDQRRDQLRKMLDNRRQDRRALRDAFAKGADVATIRPLAEKQGKFVTEMIIWKAEGRAAVDKILTDAQRKELAKMRKEWMQRYHDRGWDHGRRGDGDWR